MIRSVSSSGKFSILGPSSVVSVVLVSLMLVSGIGYAWQTTGGGEYGSQNLNLVITAMSKTSGPSYTIFTVVSTLPASTATANAGPFAPGDVPLVISYTVKNTGNIPASLSTFGVSVSPSGSGFMATDGPIPSSLNAGASFSSSITITFTSGLGNSYERSKATITLQISGAQSTSTSCTTTVTHTTTKTVTTTKTITTTKTTTKWGENVFGASALWATTSTCSTITFTATITTTLTTFTTTTKTTTLTTSTKTSTTTSCHGHDYCY